jgi:heme exporter protein A
MGDKINTESQILPLPLQKLAISVQNLLFSRDDFYLYVNFSLSIQQGEWVVLRGANGSGKSTLLKLIAGHILPEAGEIFTIPFDYLGHKNGQRSYLTVGQHLHSKMILMDASADLDTILTMCNLTSVKDFPISKLSAGQQRKVALASLFFTPHKLWILDEPLDHLDQQSQKLFEDLFQRHVCSGGTILQSSHMTYPAKEIWLGKLPEYLPEIDVFS